MSQSEKDKKLKLLICELCQKKYKQQKSLLSHYLDKHQWIQQEQRKATMAEIEARKKEKAKCKNKSEEKNEFDDPEAEEGNKAKNEESEYSTSDFEVEIEEEEVLTISSDTEENVEYKQQDESLSIDEAKVVDSLPSVSMESPKKETFEQKKHRLTGWSPAPRPIQGVSESDECMKRKYSKQKVVPPGKLATLRAQLKDDGVKQAARIPSLTRSAMSWPSRRDAPPIKDLITFRKTANESTPTQIAQKAQQKFGWTPIPKISTEQYARGVIATYDYARRELLDEFRAMIKETPETAEVAQQRYGWLKIWAEEQYRPATPEQLFDD